MSVTNPTGNPASYPATVQRKSDGEPSTDFWASTFDPLLNRTSYLQDQLLGATNGLTAKLASQTASSSGVRLVGVEAHTGANAQGNYAAQLLFTLLGTLWDTKGGLSNTNTWNDVQTFTEKMVSEGRKQMLRPRIILSDAPHTCDVSQADRFVLPANPAAPRIITLDKVGVVPTNGETMTFLLPSLTSSAQPTYSFKRNDATVVATVNGSATSADAGAIFIEFEYASGVWRMGANSGKSFDDNTFTVFYGVIPGAGA